MAISPEQNRFAEIFLPQAFARGKAIEKNGTRFVHYTSAREAMEILRTKNIWMRNVSCMNDFMEVQYGLNCLSRTYNGEEGDKFKSTLDCIFPGISKEIEDLFNSWRPTIRDNTYLTCVSEHIDNEDEYGRLSMWRAYGQETGVALVVNNTPFLVHSDALATFSIPVTYVTDEGFREEFRKIASSIEKNIEFIQERGRDDLMGWVFYLYRVFALCTKHPGFHEEKEWRVHYSLSMNSSQRIEMSIEIVNGVPQKIYKIPLKNVPDEGLIGLEIPEFIDRIIIGPTQFAKAAREAFVYAPTKAGVEDSEKRVVISDIPLR